MEKYSNTKLLEQRNTYTLFGRELELFRWFPAYLSLLTHTVLPKPQQKSEIVNFRNFENAQISILYARISFIMDGFKWMVR